MFLTKNKESKMTQIFIYNNNQTQKQTKYRDKDRKNDENNIKISRLL